MSRDEWVIYGIMVLLGLGSVIVFSLLVGGVIE